MSNGKKNFKFFDLIILVIISADKKIIKVIPCTPITGKKYSSGEPIPA